jgi:AraC-like DNA-binding protein
MGTTGTCHYGYHLHVQAGHRCQQHEHLATEIVCVLGGSGELHQDDQVVAYQAGECFVYQPPGRHWIDNQVDGEQVCLCVGGCGAERLLPGIRPINDAMHALARRIGSLLADPEAPLRRERLDCLAGSLVLELRAAGMQRDHDQDPAAMARALIDAHFSEHISISNLARRVFVSPDYLRQLFRAAFATSPQKYLIDRRIAHASDLLQRSDLSIGEVAAACGIDNPYYFSRLFRRVMGCTPSAYRTANAGDAADTPPMRCR